MGLALLPGKWILLMDFKGMNQWTASGFALVNAW